MDDNLAAAESGAQTADMPASAPAPVKKRRKRGRAGLLLFAALLLIAGAGVFGTLALTGKTIRLPLWIVVEVEERINRAIGETADARLSVGRIDVTVGRQDWTPRLRLNDVNVTRRSGENLLTLPEARITFDPGAIAKGQLRASAITLVGAQIVLRRAADGQFDLEFGADAAGQAVGSLADLLDRVDALLSSPALSSLKMIDAEALSLRLDDRRANRVWDVGDGRLQLENKATGVAAALGFSLIAGGVAPASAKLLIVTERQSRRAKIAATVENVAASDLALQAGPLAWLQVLDAPLSGEVSAQVDDQGQIASLDGTLDIAKGALRPLDGTRPIAFDRAGLTLHFQGDAEKLLLSDIMVQSPSLRLNAAGQVLLPGVAQGIPDAFLAQIAFSEVMVDPEGLFVEPMRFSAGALDMRLRLDPFVVDIGQLSLVDDGRHLTASGDIAADPAGWKVAIDVALDKIRHDRLLALWPVSVVPKTRAWLQQNVQEGLLSDVKVAFRLTPDEAPHFALGYEFQDGDVRFLKTLPPIKQGSGYATIEGNTYTMVLDAGQVMPALGGAIDMKNTVFSVLDILQKPAQAEIRLLTDSTLTAALSLLDEPPFQFLTKAGRPVELGQGRAQLDATLRLPLMQKVKLKDVRYEVSGRITDFSSDVLVPGRVLTAKALSLTADPAGMTIAGPGQIGKVPFDATFSQGFLAAQKGKSRVEGTVTLSPAALAEFAIGLPRGMVAGEGRGKFSLDLRRGSAPALELTSDLTGLTLTLPDLGWAKARNTKGRLGISATLGKPARVTALVLEGAGLAAKGAITLRGGGGLDKAVFESVRLNNWLDAEVTLTGRGKGRDVGISLTGGSVDLRKLIVGKGKGARAAGGAGLDVRLDRLTVSDGIALTGFRGKFARSGGLNGTFSAKVNQVAAVVGTVVPSSNGTAVRITSDDAGAVLASAGIFNNARGGKLDLQLVPNGPAGYYQGTAFASNMRVRNAPVLAELLSAISVVGILEQLNGEGLFFTESDAQFRLTPQAIEVTRAAAIGASMGVSMAGVYDMSSKRLDMQGVISPIYLLNGIGAILTRRGEGLFGFNYRLGGTAESPRVQVNPLSILTPGMFREIFRRAPPKIQDNG